MELLSLIMPGIYVILGALASFFGTYFLRKREDQLKEKALARSFYGEIYSILEIIDKRKYMTKTVEALNKLEKILAIGADYKISIHYNYFNVFDTSVGKIGLLSNPLPEKIILFYSQLFAILEDLQLRENDPQEQIIAKIVNAAPSPIARDKLKLTIKHETLKQNYELLVASYNLGQEICKIIEQKYPIN
jgi:hypothetical protein